MHRKEFLITTSALAPLLAFPQLNKKSNRTKKPFLVTAGKSRFSEVIKLGLNTNDVKVSKSDTDNQLTVFEYTGYEKVGPPLHLHFNQDEIFYVTEGTYRFVVGEEKMELTTGDTIFLPRNIPHTWVQLTEKGKLVYMVQPAGKMEEFFRELNGLTRPPTEDEIQKIHLLHGMKVMGPPLSI